MTRAALSLLVFLSAPACLADWPGFRGPNGNGVCAEALPAEWGETTNVAWAIDVPGDGWSAPIVVGDRVLITTAVPIAEGREGTQRFEVRCYDLATGAERWTRVAAEQPSTVPTHRDNTFASETPVADDQRVYAYFGMNGVYCYTLDGEPVWQRDLGAYPMRNGWGTSSSLAMLDGRLFVQIDNEEDSHVLALDAQTGETVWRVERPGEVSNWCTPVVWRNSARAEVVLAGKTVKSYDPATGDELWSLEIGGRSSATPAPAGDLLVFGAENRSRRGGTPGGLFAVRAGASGDIDATAEPGASNALAWANARGAIGISSPLVVGDSIFVLPRRGAILRVHSLETGEQTHRGRMPGGAAFWASPWTDGERVYLLDDAGTTFVLDADGGYDPIATNELPGRFWSTPAASEGSLLLRSADRLYCVRVTAGG